MNRRRANSYQLAALVLLGLALQTASQTPKRCEPQVIGSGSGAIIQTPDCGDNSICQNNAQCLCVSGYFSPNGSEADCRANNDPDPRCSSFDRQCVFCGSSFQGPCIKCAEVIYEFQCLSSCPEGTQLAIMSVANFDSAVRTCTGTRSTAVLQEWAIIVIIVLGVVVLIVIAILIAAVACTCLRRSNVGELNIAERQEKTAAQYEEVPYHNEEADGKTDTDTTNTDNRKSAIEKHFEVEDDSYHVSDEEKEEFFAKLAALQDQSESFLKMLNDMRRRLKELPQSSSAVQQYKNVMRDLTRLLYMLNKKPEKIRIPPDGIQLLTWAEQLLNRYLLAQGKPPVSSPTRKLSPTKRTDSQRLSTIGDTAETDF